MHSIAMRYVNTIADIINNAFDRMQLEVIVPITNVIVIVILIHCPREDYD